MPQRRAEASTDVEKEVQAGRLKWTFENVYGVVQDHPARSARFDCRDDDGSETGPEDDEGDSGSDRDEPSLNADTVPMDAPAQVGSEIALRHDESNWMHRAQEKLRVWRDVLDQVRQVGADGVSATLQHAVNAEEKRLRCSKRVAPEVGLAFAREQEREHLEFLRRREQVRAELERDRERRQTISELIKQQKQLYDKRMQLERASTTVECMNALKRWNAMDLGQGHVQGGSRLHLKIVPRC